MVVNPNSPLGPWFHPLGGGHLDPPGVTVSATGSAPTGSSSAVQQAEADVARWEQYVATIQQALAQSAGWERRRLEAELEDAEKGRQNALAIARLQAETSRYGVDVGRQNLLDQLQEQGRQFDARHALDMQRFGLDVAQAWTQYAQTPDQMFMRRDFEEGLSRAGVGLGPTPYGAQGQPRMKTWEDFAALSGYGAPPLQAGQQQGGDAVLRAHPVRTEPGAVGPGGSFVDANRDGIPDVRQKAIRAIADAIPPSESSGMDDNDFAALQAIESVFRAARPGTLQRMRTGQRQAFAAGLSRLGYYAPDALEEMQRSAPGQQSVRRA